MVLKALRDYRQILPDDIQSVEDTPAEVFDEYIEEENFENFSEYFLEVSKVNVKPFPFPEDKEQASKYSELEHIINNYRRLRLGKYYSADAKGRTKLKLIVFKYREMFGVHKWNVGRIRRDFYVHRAEFRNDRYHRTKCRPFKLSPREKTVIAKYLKNLVENEIVTPVADAHAGVNLFLVSKISPSGVDNKEGNEGWEELRARYEKEFNIKSETQDTKKKNVVVKPAGQTYEEYKREHGIEDEYEDELENIEGEVMPDTWKVENALIDLADDEIKNSQVINEDGVTEVRRVHNLFDLKDPMPYDRGKEGMIKFLEGEAKRDLSAEELGKMGEPESQFSKCGGVKKVSAPIDMCIAVALTYRTQSKWNSQRLITNITEARSTMIQAIRAAIDVSTKQQVQIFASAQGFNRKRRADYCTFLEKLEKFYEENLTVKKWNTSLPTERPYGNKEEEFFFRHFTAELPYYISLMNRQPLYIINYDKGKIRMVEKYCLRDRKINYNPQKIRIPLFIARTLGRENYSGLRIPDGDYLHFIMQYMEEKELTVMDAEEFNKATSLFFNMDTRLTIEKPTKSEDDWRKSNLESTLREAKDLQKDFKRTSQNTNYRPVVNCLLMNLSVQKNVTVLPEPKRDIQKLANMTIFTIMDFSNFFFQISADEQYSRDVCIVTELGTFSPNVALQGDTNSPGSSTFISNSLLYKVEKGISLIDDLLFANNTVERHLEDFERILSNIAYVSEARRPCKLRTDKIHLLTDKVEYCGNILKDGKVKISSHKLEDYLRNEPTTYGQMVSVICLANWYAPALSVGSEVFKEIRDEIKDFSSSTTITWTDKLRKNYDVVISLLKEVPPMFIPDWYAEDLTFTIHVDSSQLAIGCLLGQEVPIREGSQKPSKVANSGKGMPGSYMKKDPIKTIIQPITYYSRVLLPNERNLPIMHLELRAMYEACVKFRDYTRGSCKLKLYSDNSGVYYLLKKMLADPNLKLDDQMAKIVALLHGTQAEIHFVSTDMNPADFMTRAIPETETDWKNKTKRVNHIHKNGIYKMDQKDEEELEEYLTKGKASERHKHRMELPRVDQNGVTKYKHTLEEYEGFPLQKLFDRLSASAKPEKQNSGILVNRRNVANIIERAIINNIKTDQLGVNLYGGIDREELEALRIKQRENPKLRKLIKELQESKNDTIMRGTTQFKMSDGILMGNPAPYSNDKFKFVVPEEDVVRLTFLHHKLGHRGINKLYLHLKDLYVWNIDTGSKDNVKETVEKVVKSCLECAVYQRPSKHRYIETFKTLHASQQYNCGAVVFMDHYSVGKTTSKYKEMIGAVCGRCKRAIVEPVERANSKHTAAFIMRQVCNPLIPSRLISDHGSPISLGAVPKLIEAINSGIANFYNLNEYRTGGDEQKLLEDIDTTHRLQSWKSAHEKEFKDDDDKQEQLHDAKLRINEFRKTKEIERRERMAHDQWKKIHRNKDVRRMEHVKSSVYHPTSHSSIERFFLTFSTLIRKLFTDERDRWTDYVDQVVALYNNTGHKALRGHSPNSAHFNLAHDQTRPMIHQYLSESESKHPFVVEEKKLFARAKTLFDEAGIDKYFEPVDAKEIEKRKHEGKTGPQIGDLVWVRRMKRLDKHPEEGYLMGPCLITDKPSSQQVEVLFLLNGHASRRHYGQVTQFFRPIGTDTENLLEYSSAPRLYTSQDGRRVSAKTRDQLIKELETGLQGKTYMSGIDDLEEVDMMLSDKFSLLDHPEPYSEETERIKEEYYKDTIEGQALRDKISKIKWDEDNKDENLEEIEELDDYEEEDDIVEEEEEEEERGKTVRWNLPTKEIGCSPNEEDILESRTRSGSRITYSYAAMEKKQAERKTRKTKFPRVWEPDEDITDENTYQLALAKRNMKISGLFQETMSINDEKMKRSPRRVRFA